MAKLDFRVIDLGVWYAGIASEALLVGLAWKRGIARRLPLFTLFLAWAILEDLVAIGVAHSYPDAYLNYLQVEIGVDTFMQCLVLAELARGALRSLPVILARVTVMGIFVFILGLAGVLWRFTDSWALAHWSAEWHMVARIQFEAALVRIAFLLVLGALIQLLSSQFVEIGWGDRELQVTTGMGLYSLVSLGATLGHTYSESARVYHAFDTLVELTYFGVLLYWVFCFIGREEPHRKAAPMDRRLQPAEEPRAKKPLERRRLDKKTHLAEFSI